MNNPDILCPVCEEGTLRPDTYEGSIKVGSEVIKVPDLECNICSKCGADPILEDQIRRNHVKYADARRAAAGLLTSKDIKMVREKFCLTQSEACRIFGGGANAFSKYERGDVIQSTAMDTLMCVLMYQPSLINFLRIRAGLEPIEYHTAEYVDTVHMQFGCEYQNERQAAKVINAKSVTEAVWIDRRTAA